MNQSSRFACALATLALAVVATATLTAAAADDLKPKGKDGRALNLDFETGTLRDWTATGTAFAGQPIQGDTVSARRGDMKSAHHGSYWIGGFEKAGDDPQGTLTSAAFPVTQPWASFLVAGGAWPGTRVELVRADTQQVFFKTSGYESEELRPVIVDLRAQTGREIFIRLVDEQGGHWGHLNFDNFVFHAARPQFANALDPAQLALANAAPPADVVPFAGLSPEDAAKSATLPTGFKLHLFAGEPDVKQPIAFCQDHRGRLWVAEGYTYPKRRGNPPADSRPAGPDRAKPSPEQLQDIFGGADRIVVFEDTNGDHKFDKRTVFLEGLNLVSGLEFGFGGLWVGAAPYLLFIPIADGDEPKPAGPPQILLDGWNYTADTHETLNTFTWGPDGWLYGCHGVFCPSHVGKPGAPEAGRQWCDAGVWRYHPTRHTFEIFAEGTSNPWGVDFDEHGQCWIEACVIPHLWQLTQGGRYERQGGEHYSASHDETVRNEASRDPRSRKPIFPYVYEDIKTVADHVHYAGNKGPHAGNARSDAAGGGHAHAGMMVYLGTSWPAEYRGSLFMGNIHGQRLNMDVPERRGSGFVGHHGKDFLNFNDTWSQTLNQLYDPDGSVYVIDWYDKNQCHHNNVEGHDRSNGRIYKIVYHDQPKTRVDLEKLSDAELVKLVPSKNEWLSRHARRVLQERVSVAKLAATTRPELVAQLEKRAGTTERLRALWALQVTGGITIEDYVEGLKSKDEWLRAWVIQLAFESPETLRQVLEGRVSAKDQQQLKEELSLNEIAVADSSPLVRRYVASALQRIPVGQREGILTGLLKHGEDANDPNLPLMYWYAAEACVAAAPERAVQLLQDCRIPKVREFIARRMTAASLTSAK